MPQRGAMAPVFSRPGSSGTSKSAMSDLFSWCCVPCARRRLFLGMTSLFVCSACNLAIPHLLGMTVDAAQSGWSPQGLAAMLGVQSSEQQLVLVSTVFLLGAISSLFRTEMLEKAEEEVLAQIRLKLFRSLMHAPPSYFMSHNPGALSTLFQDSAPAVSRVITRTLAQGIRYSNSAVGGSVMLLLLSKRLTALALVLLPLAGCSAMLVSRYVRHHRVNHQRASEEVGQIFVDRLYAHRTVYLHQQQDQEVSRFAFRHNRALKTAFDAARASGIFMGIVALATDVSLLAVLTYGAKLVRRGSLTYGGLTSFAVYSTMVGMGFSGLASLFTEYTRGKIGAQRIMKAIDDAQPFRLVEEDRNALDIQPNTDDLRIRSDAKIAQQNLTGEVVFEDVWFEYETHNTTEKKGTCVVGNGTSRETAAVKGITLRLHPGEWVAIAGPSGSGKSTLVKLLTKEILPQRGRILINGVDINQIPTSELLREVLGVVNSSSSKLFDGLSFRENILYGSIDAKACRLIESGIGEHPSDGLFTALEEDRMISSARLANCYDFISDMRRGFSTLVGGEDGLEVSNGEQQRIGIARALAKDPTILVFDEATSNLDERNERLIQDTLSRFMSGNGQAKSQRSILMIAHKPTSLQAATRVVVMHEGRLVEEGTFQTLRAKKGELWRLINGLDKLVA